MEAMKFELHAEQQSHDLHRIYKYVVHFNDASGQGLRQHLWVYCTEPVEIILEQSDDKYAVIERMARVKLGQVAAKANEHGVLEIRLTSEDLNNG